MKRLAKTLQRLFARRAQPGTQFDLERDVYCGLETRTSTDYYWDGMKRRADPAHPYVVFQYTLDGWGYYAEASPIKVQPGMAFSAVCPSRHRYYYSADAPPWTFFWLVVHHPYVVKRLVQTTKKCGAVLTIPPESVLVSAAVNVVQGICLGAFHDPLAQEQALFEFMLAYERFGNQMLYSQPLRDRILEETRNYVLKELARPIGTSELAQMKGMSRSHFGHYFKAATGLSPAHFVTQVRLQEVSRRLVHSKEKLEAIARATGFADANHLCKVFRRHRHLSPGEFRRQMQ